jgi:glycosyltransferase involved in cell wall biosynthesis
MDLTAVFPAHNEELNIRSTIDRAVAALRPLCNRFEILIVNDASRDDTGRIADELARQYPEIRVIHNASNLGQGGSIVRGFKEARYEWAIHNAMDYPFDFKDLDQLFPFIGTADIVVAARDRYAGYTFRRKAMSWANRRLLRLLFGLNLRDYNFVQLYRKSVWEKVRVESKSTAFLTPEALIRAHDMGFRIVEVVTRYHSREKGVATSGSLRVISHSLRDMFRFWWHRSGTNRREYIEQTTEHRLEAKN